MTAELHDAKHQPELKNARPIGMPLDEFTEQAYQGLAAGKEQVPVSMAQEYFENFELRRQEDFHRLN